MKCGIQHCRKCGKEICVLTFGMYRNCVVDAGAVTVVPDPEGEEYVRMDGSKIKGRPAEFETTGAEYAYRLHRKSCGGGT